MEVWLPIVGFEGLYEISSEGRVKSISFGKGSRANINGGIISGWIQSVRGKYKRKLVSLRKDNKTATFKVARLVLTAFKGEPEEGMVSRHKNGNSLKNTTDNLKWGTQIENVRDSIRHGTKTPPPIHKGDTHPNMKITEKQAAYIRNYDFKHGDVANLAKRFKVHTMTISRIKNGSWRV